MTNSNSSANFRNSLIFVKSTQRRQFSGAVHRVCSSRWLGHTHFVHTRMHSLLLCLAGYGLRRHRFIAQDHNLVRT
jgi:hypothetical protein